MLQIIIFDKKSSKMKKLFLSFLIIFIISLSACTNKAEKDTVKVMTMNVRYDNPNDSINAWPNRIPLVCSFILKEKPDIIGLQEVLWHQYAVMDSALTGYSSVGAGRDDGEKGGEMNPVFFRKDRFDLVRTITFWLSNTPEVAGSKGWGASLPRIVTWLELVDKNKHEHFFCFNTHFAHDSDSARIMSSKILLNQVGNITEGFPFIITGDFNMAPSSTGYSILTGPAESVPLLRDTYLLSDRRPSGPVSTFNGYTGDTGSGRIDYIFVRNGMKVMNHTTFVVKENNIYISDHWPVMAEILLK
jgi:endonuclease/exonuclease/phosphatase family metal-dependent hydrolase